MFKISPIGSFEEQKACANECGAIPVSGYFAYSMRDTETGELMGFSQFEITERGGYIKDLKSKIGYDDFEAMFILGRQTMNFIDLCGTHTCYAARDAASESLIRSIGFKVQGEEYFVDMNGMFDGNCGGHTVKLPEK